MVEKSPSKETDAQESFTSIGHGSKLTAIFFDASADAKPKYISPPQQLLIGRDDGVDVYIEDSLISRRHALFTWDNDRLMIKDLGSRNGIWLHGVRISSAVLSSGDVLYIGNTRVVVAFLDETMRFEHKPPPEVAAQQSVIVLNREMQAVYEEIEKVASLDISVLILGETGSGKEHVATALHTRGNRRDRPFKVINCGAIPHELTESVFFGYEKGAFTGATSRRIGMFEQANTGILFLDEVGDLSPTAQASLLRAIETKRISRLGSQKETEVNVRVIAATNRNLDAMVKQGTFRKDLLYRLNPITLSLPPLRERPDEILPLVEFFLSSATDSLGRTVTTIHPEAIKKLQQYDWPGNIRQLKNVIERSILCSDGHELKPCHLPKFIVQDTPRDAASVSSTGCENDDWDVSFKQQLRTWEIDKISAALRKTSGNQSAAARLLQMPLRTLTYKLKEYGLLTENWMM